MQSTRQSLPLHVTFFPHASMTPHEMLHFCALHVMSSPQEPEPAQSTLHCEPPQLIGCVHDEPPLQWMAHALALLQSSVPLHDWKPQSIAHGMFAGQWMSLSH